MPPPKKVDRVDVAREAELAMERTIIPWAREIGKKPTGIEVPPSLGVEPVGNWRRLDRFVQSVDEELPKFGCIACGNVEPYLYDLLKETAPVDSERNFHCFGDSSLIARDNEYHAW